MVNVHWHIGGRTLPPPGNRRQIACICRIHLYINRSDKVDRQIAYQYPLGRYGSLEDAAAAVAWLMPDAAQWITGQVLPVDGGYSVVRPMIRS